MISSTLLFLLLSVSGDDAPEWGGFRGSNGTGIAGSSSVPSNFDPAKAQRWRVEIPPGYSSPTVAGDRVFVTAAEGKELLTMCLDRESGEILWKRALEFNGARTGANSPAAPTPVTDGESVFALFHNFGLIAYDLDGGELWSKPLGPFNIPHGLSTSPVIHEDFIIIQVDQDGGSYLLVLDKYEGEEVWKMERQGSTHGYATPAVYTPAEGPAQIIVSGSMKISSHSLEDGELLWWVTGSAFMPKGVPVIVGDRCYLSAYAGSIAEAGLPKISQTFEEALKEKDTDGDGMISTKEFNSREMTMAWMVFDLNDDGQFDESDWNYLLSSSKPTGGLFAIRLDGKGDVTESHVAWTYDGRRGLPDVTSALMVNGTVFLIKAGGLMSSFDAASGELAKQGRVGESDRYFASPVAAGDKIITVSLGGQISVVSARPEWEVISTTDLGEETWSTPAIADGEVFIRTQEALYCFAAPTEE